MERAKDREKDISSVGEPDLKRYKVDPDTVKGKNVVVLLDTDVVVAKNGQEKLMPNTIEMAQIKKPKKGRFVTNVKFTSEMTERDVRRVLRQKLNILNYKRKCASASYNRTRLNFHGEPRLWSGELIRRHIRGNSALYLLVEGNPESSVVPDTSQVLHVPTGTVSVAAASPLKDYSSVPSSSQQRQSLYIQGRQENVLRPAADNNYLCSTSFGRLLQQSVEHDMVVGKTGSVPQQSVPPSEQQGNGTCYFTQAGADHGKSAIGQQPTSHVQLTQQEISSMLGAAQNSSLQVSSVASQLSVNQVPVTPSVQHQAELKDGTALLGIPSKQSLAISVPQGTVLVPAPTQRLQELSQTSTTADQWEITGKGKDSLNALPIQAGKQVTADAEKLSDTFDQTKRKSYPHDPLENSVFDQIFQIVLTERESSDSGVQSMWEESMNSDYDTEAGLVEDLKPVISPCKGSTKGGDQFHIILQDFVPGEVVSCVAIFEGCGEVLLDVVNPFTLSGYTPCSKGPGLVKVRLRSFDGSWKGGETEFLYEDLFTKDELLIQLVKDPEMQHKMFGWMFRGMNNPSNQQTSSPSDEMGQGSSVMNQSRYAMSVKLLHCLVYKAAEIDGQEFIQVIFSTSAGKVIFNSYKNNAVLPEDVARANGHTVLADYLQHVNNRLSKETFDSRTGSIDWFELMHAIDEKQSLPFNDDAQMLKIWCSTNCPQSDDNESDYFADDEASSCSLPSDSEVSDSENLEGVEPENVVFEQEQSLVPSCNHTGNRHELIPCTETENAVEHIQLFCDKVVPISSSEGSLLESKFAMYEHASDKTEQSDHPVENTVSHGSELGDWEVRESENVSFKQEQSSVLPMKHTGNQLQFNLCPMYEQFATEYVLICSPIRLTHTIANSKDGSNEGGLSEPKIEEDEHAGLKMDQHEPIKNTFLVGNEVMLDWNSSKSEVKSTILEVPTGTRSSHNEDVVNVSSHQETECIQNTCPGECELRYWNTLKSKRISSFNAAEMVAEIVAETERCHAAVAKVLLQLMETNDVMETNDSEDVLDRDKEVCMKIHNDKTTHSRAVKTENIKECGTQDCRDSPPQINFKVSKLSDLPKTLRRFNDAEHLVDVLLLTVDECEFLACYSYLKKPFRSFYSDIGYVYFGSMGNDTKETLKIALMRCFAGSFDPGGSLTVVKNGVRVLRPKAVFSIGACSGLNRAKVRLGDVVISSKPITLTHKNPASRCIGTLIRHAADGWNAPLENPDAREVKVHYCDCEILSSQEVISEDIIQQCPKAIALEIEHEGLFSAAHDLETDWVFIKGIKNYADDSQPSSDEWGVFASVMAASVAANILSDPVTFEEWSHSSQVTESEDISFKQEQSSALPMKHPGNQLKFILHTMNENAADYVRLFPDKVASHNSEDDWEEVSEGGLAEPKIEEDEHAGLKTDQHEPIKNTFLAGNEVRLDWDSSKSEVKSTILEVLTGTRSLHNKDVVNVSSHQETERIENTFPGDCELRSWNTLKSKRKYTSNSAEMLAEIKRSLAAKVSRQQETDDVMETNDSEDVLDRDKEVFKKIHNDKTTHSRGLIPPAILANAYKGALEHGKTRDKWVLVVFNFRGERPGKTSLVRSLRGESFNKDEARTAGIQMDSPLLRVGIQPWKPVPQSVKYTVFDRKIFQLVARRLLGGFHELERSPTKITPYDVLKACPAEKKGQTTGVEGSGYNVDLELLHSQTGGIRSPQGSPPSQCREVDESGLFTEPTSQVLQVATFDSQSQQAEIWPVIWDLEQRAEQRAEAPDTCQTNLDNLMRWLYSVQSIQDPSSVQASGIAQPPIILVRTHADKVVGEPWHVMDTILNSFEGNAFSLHMVGEKFLVDNPLAGQPFRHKDPNVQRPRKKILPVTSALPHTKREIPLQWLCVEKLLHRLASNDVKHITSTDFKAIANKMCQFEEEEDSEELLHFLCDCGAVLYFNEADHSDSLVIVDPVWLINVFCQIITVMSSKEEPVQIRAHRRTLAKDGILSEDLINYAFQNLDLKLSPDSLLSTMEKYNLICRWVRQNGEVVYLVPSMLPAKPDKEISGLITQGSIEPIYVRFHAGYVPHGLFSRFVVLFGQNVSYELSTRLPMHFSNAARFFLGERNNYKLTFACFKSVITIHLVHEGKSEDGKETAAICEQVCRFVEDTLALLGAQCPWLHSMAWQLSARCDLCVGEGEDPDGCSWHHVHSCLHPDCAHFIPLDSQPLRCDKTYKLNTLLTDDKLQPWMKHFHHRDQDTGQQSHFKADRVSRDDLLLLARDMGKQWHRLGCKPRINSWDLPVKPRRVC